ncbi:MAG: HAMP domain-containing histidine kinase [Cyanobacteria bacterium]|nr:HAMP domain-containing histidine kinase [Cyanobacteriota bacterium]
MAWATDFIHNCRIWTRVLRHRRGFSPTANSSATTAAARPGDREIGAKLPPIGAKLPPIATGRTAEAAQFQALRQRLLRSFLLVMVTVVGLGSVVAIEFLIHSLYEQLDRQLLLLAQAAGHSLEEIAEEYEEQFVEGRDRTNPAAAQDDDDDDDDEDEEEAYEYDPHQKLVKAMRSPGDRAPFLDDRFFDQRQELQPRLDNDGDLDIPWQNLQQPDQGVEWFNAGGVLLARQGTLFPHWPLDPITRPQGVIVQEQQLRTLTAPLYDRDHQPPRLRGYVRVTESIEPINRAIRQLGQGLAIGSSLAIGLSLVGGLWLTRQSLRPIEASFRKLRQFTADASHELRGPLTAIRTSVEVMQSHPERIDPADVAKLAAIHNATDQMTQLVEDLLLLARQDTPGAVVHQVQPLDLAELLESLMETYGDRAAVQRIDLVGDLPPTVVLGEPLLLWRLFGNLLDNALKYTPEGGRVSLTIAPNRRDRRVRIEIQDTGIGIAPADLPHIFDRLWRADQVRSHRQGGSGLGLSIAQAIAQSHQGQISVQSQPHQGSCFTVTLPLPAPTGKAAIA